MQLIELIPKLGKISKAKKKKNLQNIIVNWKSTQNRVTSVCTCDYWVVTKVWFEPGGGGAHL